MSSQAASAPVPEQSQPKEVPPLTDSYRKAHKSYVLVSGLLASWELIGITLDTKEKWGIELKSPSAVPLILFTLLLYSGYKVIIEWLQSDAERQRNAVARLDHWVAHGIALTAVIIGFVQYLSHIRIADILFSVQGASVVNGLIVGLPLGVTGGALKRVWATWGTVKKWSTLVPLVVFGLVAVSLVIIADHPFWVVVGSIAGIGIGIAMDYLRSRIDKVIAERDANLKKGASDWLRAYNSGTKQPPRP